MYALWSHTRRSGRAFGRVFLFAVLLTAWGYGRAGTLPDPPLIEQGKRYLLNGEAEQAIEKFSEHLRRNGFSDEAYYWRAHALLGLGLEEEAENDLRFLLQYHPNDSRALDALGFLENRWGNYREALTYFNKAIARDNKNAITYNNRGMCYYNSGNYVAAFQDFNKAILLDSTFAEAYSNRGSARYNNQNIAAATRADLLKAEADFSRALSLDARLVSAYRNRALVRMELGKHRDCYLDLQKAIHLDPGDARLYHQLGLLYLEMGDYAEAVAFFAEALKRRNDMRESLYGRARAYELQGKPDLALYDLEQIGGRWKEERGEAAYRMAVIHARMSDPENAIQYLREAQKAGHFNKEANLRALRKETAFDDMRALPAFKRIID